MRAIFQRCLLSWGDLALMLWILLLAAYLRSFAAAPGVDIARSAAFMAGISLLFAAVGNRGLMRIRSEARVFIPPPPNAS